MANKNRNNEVIYDRDSVRIERSESKSAPVTADAPFDADLGMDTSVIPVKMAVADMIDTLAGYMMPNFSVNHSQDGPGECAVCHKSTQYARRKLCADCIKKQGAAQLADALKNAVNAGKKTVYIYAD